MAFNEKREMQELYRDQKNTETYEAAREEVKTDRHTLENNTKLTRRTAVNGNAHQGRRQDGVRVLSGNSAYVMSDTKNDDARPRFYATGVPIVNQEASSIGAPIAPGDDLPWETTVSSPDTMEGEV